MNIEEIVEEITYSVNEVPWCKVKSPGYLTFQDSVVEMQIGMIRKPNFLKMFLFKCLGFKFIEEKNIVLMRCTKESILARCPTATFEDNE